MALHLDHVSFAFKEKKDKKTPILSDFSLTVKKGEFVSIIGKSGTGKSTILKLITGLLSFDEGTITINGKAPSKGNFGYMPQRDLLLPWRTVLGNLTLVSEIQKNSKVTKEEVKALLKRVGLSKWEDALPKQLSGGMKQRVAFLRTVLIGSDVLLLDEPFGALDTFTKKDMQSWLLSIWNELDKTILFITHDLEEAVLLSDRILILHQNKEFEEMEISLPRPRNPEIIHTVEVLEYRKELEKRMTNGVV